MRWFKHMAHSADDEKLSDFLCECGLEGYGFWWRLLEIISSHMEKGSDKCSVTYPLTMWSRLLYSHHHKVGKYLGKLEVRGMVRLMYVEGKIEVSIPNLLKYRDEYSKKSGQKKDNVRSKIQRQNTETEKEESIKDSCSEQDSELSFILKDGSRHVLPNSKISEWEELYDSTDVRVELRKLIEWCENNPSKRKTKDGANRFVCKWLNRADESNRQRYEGKTNLLDYAIQGVMNGHP